MELTLKLRKTWAVGYLYQDVKVYAKYGDTKPAELFTLSISSDTYLLLKNLKDFTYGDLVAVARCYYGHDYEKKYNELAAHTHISKVINDYRVGKQDILTSAYQYLQSQGYALPWRGISVIQMEIHGWLKLIVKTAENGNA